MAADDVIVKDPSARSAGVGILGLVPGDRTTIPASHRDLVECPPVAALTTLMPDGSPQTSVVWCDFDGAFVRVNTMAGFRKERNMRADARRRVVDKVAAAVMLQHWLDSRLARDDSGQEADEETATAAAGEERS